MKKLFTILLLLMLANTLCFGQDNSEYKDAIKKMMVVSGSEKVFQVAITQMIASVREGRTDVPAEFWDKFETEITKTSLTDLLDMLAPIYEKHLTLNDVKGIIAFYETPTGRKFAEKTPLITKDSMDAGREWGTKLGEKIVDQLQKNLTKQ